MLPHEVQFLSVVLKYFNLKLSVVYKLKLRYYTGRSFNVLFSLERSACAIETYNKSALILVNFTFTAKGF